MNGEHPEKPKPDCSLTEMLADIDAGDGAIYDGPGAYTVTEMIRNSPFSEGTIRERASEKAESGEWIQVLVQRIVEATGKAHYPLAWVKTSVYDDWCKRRGDTKKLGEEANV